MTRVLLAELLGHRLRFETSPGLFSNDRVDDGTQLLLDHLPEKAPGTVLDVGCGWGALGLPIAAAHPAAKVTLVDRDLLAVEESARNAASNGLGNVACAGSLGYRDVVGRFDWIVCNVPARIGEAAIAYLVGAGAARLEEGGELRIVVITDLGPIVEKVAAEHALPVRRVAAGPRHAIYACSRTPWNQPDHEAMYARDEVRIAGVALERPHDINEDMSHLREGIPLLLECLPKQAATALTWRGGYGAVAIALAKRGAKVSVADKDLLATAFARRNALKSGVSLQYREGFTLDAAIGADRFELVVGEFSAPAGEEAARHEAIAATRIGLKNGAIVWLGLERQMTAAFAPLVKQGKLQVTKLAARARWAVVKVRA